MALRKDNRFTIDAAVEYVTNAIGLVTLAMMTDLEGGSFSDLFSDPGTMGNVACSISTCHTSLGRYMHYPTWTLSF